MAVLPGTSRFIYENGVLVYGLNHEIRIRDIHRDVSSEKVIDINSLQREIKPSVKWKNGDLILLYYHLDILAFRVKIGRDWQLVVLDLYRKCVKLMTGLPEVKGLVVRHNGVHLFVVYFSEYYDWHWAIRKFDLLHGIEIGKPTILEEFENFGDTNQGVCFEIFSDKLHGVSNQVTMADLRSERCFYKWICISPDSESRRLKVKRIFRRFHDLHEGVSTYAELSLQVDESTGRPMILECRYERRNCEEMSCRTYYGEYLPYPENFDDDEQPPDLPLLDSTREEYRSDKLVHPEYSSRSCEGPTFSRIYTLSSFYSLSARTFMDLVNDPMANNRAAIPDKRFRLRFNSHKCTQGDKKHIATQLWPSDINVGLLNPFGTSFENRVIYANADERSVIYSLSDGEKKAIVLISFDPRITFSYALNESGETLDEWVQIKAATRFQHIWDREKQTQSMA